METINKLTITIFFIGMVLIISQLVNPLNINAALYCSSSDCWYTVCNKNSDCGTNGFTEEQFCQNNSLYQNYVTHTCNNPGSNNSSCTDSRNPQLLQTCNQKCEQGLWYIGCLTGNATTTNNTNTTNNYYNQNINYTSRSIKGCIGNSAYWYDSLGNQQELYQNCSVTGQTCYDGQCIGQSYTQPKPKPAQQPLSTSYKTSKDLIVSIFGKKGPESLQWEKNVSAINNDEIDFLLTVKNTSNAPIDKVLVKVDITGNIAYTNNLTVDNVTSDKDIVSGVDLGVIPQNTSKAISFTGVVQPKIAQGDIKVIGTINANNVSDSDFFTINISNAKPVQGQINPNTAAIGGSPVTNFLKRWNIWITIILVMVFLFIIIFRKISSRV